VVGDPNAHRNKLLIFARGSEPATGAMLSDRDAIRITHFTNALPHTFDRCLGLLDNWRPRR
jgi:hypothetical protein